MSREWPQAIEMEKKLLSAMMLKESTIIPTISTMLDAGDFYREEHKLIYRALLEIYGRGTPPDVLLVEEELRKKGELVKVNRKYLYSLVDYEWTTSRAETYAKTIKDKAILRRLIEVAEETIEDAYEESEDVEDILEIAAKKIFAITNQNKTTDFEALSSITQKSLDRIQDINNHPEKMQGISTGFLDLERVLNGLQRSDMIILAARPSMGKTALALNIAKNAARKGNVVAIFSLEMGAGQLAKRLLATESGVNSQRINRGELDYNEMEQLLLAVDRLSKLKVYIDDNGGQTILEIRSKARRLAHEVGLDLIVIDYLQLMTGRRAENRQQEISDISRNLKTLARELDVPILALSQLSRSVELRAEKKPQLSDLRESGSLEQDADIVMFLYREEYYNREESDKANVAEVIIAKNRNGPTTAVNLYFDKETMRFENLTRD